MCLQFGFVIFWRKEFGAKAAHKMLVKLFEVFKYRPKFCEIFLPFEKDFVSSTFLSPKFVTGFMKILRS